MDSWNWRFPVLLQQTNITCQDDLPDTIVLRPIPVRNETGFQQVGSYSSHLSAGAVFKCSGKVQHSWHHVYNIPYCSAAASIND